MLTVRDKASVPDVCVHVLDRSEFRFASGSLKILYLNNVGDVRVRKMCSKRCAHPLLYSLLARLDLLESFIARCLVARLLGAQFFQLSTKSVSFFVA